MVVRVSPGQSVEEVVNQTVNNLFRGVSEHKIDGFVDGEASAGPIDILAASTVRNNKSTAS